ncbi:nitroreductase family protein [Dysgonomonas sp. ZJ709]|uniref:nitroreductase family protein n=1 Tax=Dysgonomonas sp. ZJ709 TaxID=2709797 RepID=UPI0013EC23F8|nr:nitroreductase family protein [Dysgonomonas sp. ZJ709]
MKIKKVANPANSVMEKRTSIRKYDTSVKIKREEMYSILQDAMTAPSSFNLQPWRFVVIDSPAGKELIKPYMLFNQEQAATASAIIAVFGDMHNFSYADEILTANVEKNLMTEEYKDQMMGMMTNYRAGITDESIKNSLLIDCGFVSMQLMLSAKGYGYDTNPIGGYKKRELTEALGLDTKRYIPVLLLSIGKAAEESKNSIRFSVEEITQWK